ncbi:MAG: ATP-NAD/AcoX kinase [Frankiales bacterium]|nr:ATP-NAD/AcoX kinase [Frankiales bacterium]
MTRSVLLLAHTGRASIAEAARRAVRRLQEAGIEVRVLRDEAKDIGLTGVRVCDVDAGSAAEAELVLVLGGDGTILRAAEMARDAGVPLLGVNLGRVGFLAAAESQDLDVTLEHVLAKQYVVEERLTVDVTVRLNGEVLGTDWALNEASVEKAARERMLELVVEVDGRPLSRWGCDGVVAATPTGSTAYAFSAGGPVVWPTLEALLVVPISAHALFARPLVVAPSSVVAFEVLDSGAEAVLACDGRRTLPLPHRSRVEVRRGATPVLLARTGVQPFTDTLVQKFDLPVEGWRGRREGPA